MRNEIYVTNGAWVSAPARLDTIDEVADQFERPAPGGAETCWSDVTLQRAVREARLAPRLIERRAG